MADINELYGQDSSSTLEDLVPAESFPVNLLPASAVRNRAATTAFLSEDPTKSVENFQSMMMEDSTGENTTLKAMQKQIQTSATQMDLKGVLSVLSDPKISMEQKQGVIKGFQQSNQQKDTSSVLATEAVIAPSKGENLEQEEVRLTTADMLDDINNERQTMQGLVNAAMMSRKEAGLGIVPQAVESMFLPVGQGYNTLKVGKGAGQNTWSAKIKSLLAPGNSIADQREKLASLPPAQRVEFTRQILDSINANSDLLFTKDNDYAAIEKLNQYFGDEYNDTDKWVDNVTNLLDIVGVGALLRGTYKSARAGKVAVEAIPEAVGRTEPSFVRGGGAVGDPNSTVPLAQMPEARVGASNQALGALEDEYAGLLGQVQSRLEPGDVRALNGEAATIAQQRKELASTDLKARTREIQAENKSTRKEAEALARKEIADRETELAGRQTAVDERLRINSETAEAEKRLKAIEEQMNKLRKDTDTVPAKLNPIADSLRRIETNSIARTNNPSSPGAILFQTNPEKARGAFAAVFNSEGEEVAGALFGATKQDSLANAILPQVATESGRIASVPTDMNRVLREELLKNVDDIVADTGGIQFTPRELASARANMVNDFENASGLVINDSMSSFATDGARAKMSAVYGTTEGGFLRAEDAVEQAMFSLRNYGIREDEITVLAKEGLDHVPVNLADVRGKDGNYLIQVETTRNIENLPESAYEALDVKRNIFDRVRNVVPDGWGSLQRWVLDASSSLHKTITGSAINAVDRSSLLEKTMLAYADKFSNAFTKLDAERQTKMFEYIKEANFKGIAYSRTGLMGRGFTDAEVNILADWKNFWDGHYHLENLDVVRTLRRDGYQRFDNGNDELFAKPAAKNINNNRVYDPGTQSMRTLTKSEMDDLYNQGGTIATLRRPADIVGETVEHIIVDNKGKNYLRGLRDDDKALNYRDGYFQLTYKAPKFVEEVVRRANGSIEYTRAVAVAGDRKQAEAFARRQQATTGGEYNVRGDDRQIARGSNDYWDVNSVSGRIAQRHRGKTLEDVAGLNHLGGTEFIDNPVNSAIRAAQSISGRTIMRPVIDTAKERFLKQYADVLPQNEYGLPSWPSNSGQIARKGVASSKELADARTTYEYIKYLEDGHINATDDFIKGAINALAEGLGNIGLSKTERAIVGSTEGVNPTTLAKGAVFSAYIAANPVRQWIVQTHQVVRSWAYNPQGWLDGGIVKYMASYTGESMGMNVSKEGKEFISFVRGTGLFDAIDKNNLVRGTLMDAADRGNMITRPYNAVMGTLRKVGFDVGEAGNLLGHAAAVFDKYKRSGADVGSSEVRAAMHSEIRAITWDMNFAGDMPYNQNWAAMALQFMQVPHKAVLQVTNRRIDLPTRLRMVGADMLLWGAPLGVASALLPDDMLPDDAFTREAIVSGLESALINNMLTTLGRERTSVDLSSLAPYDMTGWGDMFKAIWGGGGLKEILTNAPAGQLFFKDGGRLSSAIQMTARAFSPEDADLDSMDKILNVANEIAKISSGWNNYQKASAMYVLGQARDAQGRVTDEQATKMEAIAQAFGFGTSDTKQFYETSMKLSANAKTHKEEATRDAKEILRMYQSLNDKDNDTYKRVTSITGVILRKYQSDPVAQAIMNKEFENALSNPSDNIMNKIMSAAGMPNVAELPDIIRQAPLDDQKKAQLMQLVKDVQTVRKQDYYKED